MQILKLLIFCERKNGICLPAALCPQQKKRPQAFFLFYLSVQFFAQLQLLRLFAVGAAVIAYHLAGAGLGTVDIGDIGGRLFFFGRYKGE
jgi:hypothetical protein